jgi:hypothetical protein
LCDFKKNEEKAISKTPRQKSKEENPDIERLLTQGFQTNYGGAFLLLPYLISLGIDKLVSALGVVKENGDSVLQSVLALIFLAVVGKDQETGNPVFARVEYPRKGLKPGDVAVSMLKTTCEILPELEKAVFDKWFSVGSLLEYLDKRMNVKFVTLIKMFENRVKEMKSIPPEKFRVLVGEDAMVAFKDTNLSGYSGNVKLIVVKKVVDGEEKYYRYLTNDYESCEEQIIKEKGWLGGGSRTFSRTATSWA